MTLDEILTEGWDLVENDLQDLGLDLDDPVIRTRSWRWFRCRVFGLVTRPTSVDATGMRVYPNRTARWVATRVGINPSAAAADDREEG